MTILDTAAALASDPWTALYAALASSPVVSGITLIVVAWMRKRKHDAANATTIEVVNAEAEASEAEQRARVEVAEKEHDAAVAPLLADRVKSVEAALAAKDAKLDELREAMGVARERDRAECERMRREDAERFEEQRAADRVECEKYTESRVAPLESMIATLAGIQRRGMKPDDTGAHLIEEIVRTARRTPTPPEMPAQRGPEPALVPRRTPPLPMRLETIVPPAKGSTEEE